MRPALATAILFLCLVPVSTHAYVDSLQGVLRDPSYSVAEKVKGARQLASWFSQQQLDSAITYAHVYLHWTKTAGDTNKIVDAYHLLSTINELRSNPEEAAKFVEQASLLIHQTGDLYSEFHNLNLRAAIAGDRFNTERELQLHQQANSVANQLRDSSLITISLNNLANFYKITGNIDLADESYAQALAICQARKNYLGAHIVLLNQAQLAIHRKHYARAIDLVRPVVTYFEENKHKNYLAFAYSTLGFAYFGFEEYRRALDYTQQCQKLLEETTSAYGMAEALMLTGKSYAALGQTDSALHYLSLAIAMAETTQNPEELESCYEALYQFHKAHGDLAKALYYHERYIGIRDSLEGIATRNKIEEARIRFQLKEAHYQDSLLFEQVRQKEQMELQLAHSKRNTYFAFALVAVILSCITVLIYMRFKHFKATVEKQTLLNQLDKLKSAVVKDLVLADGPTNTPTPDIYRHQIEHNLSAKLNDTDWAILLALYQTPVITNKDLAEKVNRSFEGVRSSLKKMYRLFGLNDTKGNRKAALIIKAIEFSGREPIPPALEAEAVPEEVSSTLS